MYGDISDNDIAINARNREGGGVALYVESSLNILIRNDLMPAELELICIEIHKPKFKPFLITSWYINLLILMLILWKYLRISYVLLTKNPNRLY